jgi:hypothetical protein
MTPDLMHRALVSLFGTRYGEEAAAALSLNRRTITRNVTGDTQPSGETRDKLISLLAYKHAQDRELIDLLRADRRASGPGVPRGRNARRGPESDPKGGERAK